MISKVATYEYGDNNSEVLTLLQSETMEKTASYSVDVQEYISALEKKAGTTYALVNALSAGEYYGSNRNGDYFPDKALQDYHKTFEAMGHVYQHHVNKDPEKAMGRVKFAHYNPRMKRVELVLALDNEKSASVIKALEDGKLPAVSMGCKVPFDVCSVCQNEATKTANYCDHLKNDMNNVLPSGQKVYAINTRPKFFDLSVVTIPADRTAGFLSRLGAEGAAASNGDEEDSKESEWKNSFLKNAQFESRAEIKKKIEAKIDVVSNDPKKLILASQERLSKEKIEKLAEYPFNEVLSTLLALRIVPTREDFQKMALYSIGKSEGAELLDKEGICFQVNEDTEATIPGDLSLENFNEKIAGLLLEDVPLMSLTKPLVVSRGLLKMGQAQANGTYFNPQEESKEVARVYPTPQPRERSLISRVFFGHAEEPKIDAARNPMVPLGVLGGLYYGYVKTFNDPSSSGFRKFISRHPWIFAAMLGTGAAASVWAQKSTFEKQGAAGGLGPAERFFRYGLMSVPASYYGSAVMEEKAQRGIPITKSQDFLRKHPMLVALGGTMVGSAAHKTVRKQVKSLRTALEKVSHFVSRLDETTLNKIYDDLIIN